MINYILAIDQGTSSTRAMLYTTDGVLVATSQYSLTQYYPKPGWVEHDPEEIWQKTLQAMKDLALKVGSDKIAVCGITNQRETTLLWDRATGQCLAPAIVWQDRRTQDFCDSLSGSAQTIQEKTGLLPDPYFSATKLSWLLDNIPEARVLAEQNRLAFGTIDTFLIWRLTNGKHHLTDVTNASRTLLFNIFTQEWDEELLTLFRIPRQILPKVCDSDANFGSIDACWLGSEIPVHAVLGDQQAALIGQRCLKKGMIKATFGTGGFLLMNIGTKPILSTHRLLTTIAWRIAGETVYGLEGSLYQAGTIVKWLRDEMKLIATSAETETLARSLKSNEGVYLIPSFTGLGAPYWISTAGAAIIGISRSTKPAHFARAALEAVAYQTRDLLDCMREDTQLPLSILRVDGGMAANNWFLDFLASQCQLTVQRPKDIESTAQGVAIVAAFGAGIVGSLDNLESSWRCDRIFEPDINEQTGVNYYGWRNALKSVI